MEAAIPYQPCYLSKAFQIIRVKLWVHITLVMYSKLKFLFLLCKEQLSKRIWYSILLFVLLLKCRMGCNLRTQRENTVKFSQWCPQDNTTSATKVLISMWYVWNLICSCISQGKWAENYNSSLVMWDHLFRNKCVWNILIALALSTFNLNMCLH